MMSRVVPDDLSAASAGVDALVACLVAAHDSTPLITNVVQSAVHPAPLSSEARFSVYGGEYGSVAAQGVDEVGHSDVGAGESGARCTARDAVSSYLAVGS